MSEKKGLFQRLKDGLSKTRNAFSEGVENVLKSFVRIDEDLFDELCEALICGDIGAELAMDITDELRDRVKSERVTDGNEVRALLQKIITEKMTSENAGLDLSGKPAVIMVIGVNGVGKTTSIGKLAAHFVADGKKVLLAAADTFRAAAAEQLELWADRAGADIVRGAEGADPSSVLFDACNAAKKRNCDVLICDTAGRLHNKKNLMDELAKMNRIIASTGQNAAVQAEMFSKTTDITGIILTKLDGTAKGGIVISISQKMDIPVKFIGIGEETDDLRPFDAEEFARALFEE